MWNKLFITLKKIWRADNLCQTKETFCRADDHNAAVMNGLIIPDDSEHFVEVEEDLVLLLSIVLTSRTLFRNVVRDQGDTLVLSTDGTRRYADRFDNQFKLDFSKWRSVSSVKLIEGQVYLPSRASELNVALREEMDAASAAVVAQLRKEQGGVLASNLSPHDNGNTWEDDANVANTLDSSHPSIIKLERIVQAVVKDSAVYYVWKPVDQSSTFRTCVEISSEIG
ncbi:unnamed protein product [Phytophthora lilii]|uniref:Unnamed protein product n=1 Tax=Phytophthora lilii TaxID=2077276 RepID=A0A9W6XFS3_9STRA|nr:unnamed protein product [Phytophthora lilii]